MSGSASEWVADWLGSYSSDSQTDPQGPSNGTDRVIRGGSLENQRVHQTSSNRGGSPPEWKRYSTGFRLAYMYTNKVPSDLNSTAPLTIAENQPIGTIIGEFNATDPDANATLTYSLVDGNGSGDNSLFSLDANGTLKTATTFDFESNALSYSICVQAKDEYNATLEGTFTVSLSDVYEPSLPNHVVDLNSSVNLEMIWVEPGNFTMGSPITETGRNSNETEQNATLSRGFYLGKYEVTQAQYSAVMTGNTDGLSAIPSQFGGNPNKSSRKSFLE